MKLADLRKAAEGGEFAERRHVEPPLAAEVREPIPLFKKKGFAFYEASPDSATCRNPRAFVESVKEKMGWPADAILEVSRRDGTLFRIVDDGLRSGLITFIQTDDHRPMLLKIPFHPDHPDSSDALVKASMAALSGKFKAMGAAFGTTAAAAGAAFGAAGKAFGSAVEEVRKFEEQARALPAIELPDDHVDSLRASLAKCTLDSLSAKPNKKPKFPKPARGDKYAPSAVPRTRGWPR